MYSKFAKYLFLTGIFFLLFITIQTCSRPILHNKTLYDTDILVVHFDKSKDTIENVVFFDYLQIDQMNNLIKKNGIVVSTKVKKFKYLRSEVKDL
jgi:hypothetical protein